MPIYEENEDKLILNISDSTQPVKITVDSFNGTLVSVGFRIETVKFVHQGETVELGKAMDLKGTTLEFRCSASNPEQGVIKIAHTIFEDDSNSLVYTFPDDYTGTINYDESDDNPTYVFFIKFI